MSAKNEMLMLSNVILFDLPTQEFWRASFWHGMMNMPAIQFDTSIHSFGSQNIFYHWITFLRNRMLLWRLPISILGHIRFKLLTHWQIFSGQFHFYDWSFIKCVMKNLS